MMKSTTLCLVLATLVLLCGSALADRRPSKSKLNRAVGAALREMFEDGEYQAILDHHFGHGNYQIPDGLGKCNANWPEYDQHVEDNDINSVFQTVLARGVIRFGGRHNPPLSYSNDEGAIVEGVEYDIAVAIADRFSNHYDMHVESKFYDIEPEHFFVDTIEALVAGQFDVALSGLADTASRARFVDFTCPIVWAQLDVFRTALDSELLITVPHDFCTYGATIGVVADSVAEQLAVRNYGTLDCGAEIVSFDDAESLQLATLNSGVHVAIDYDFVFDSLFEEEPNMCAPGCRRWHIDLDTFNLAPATAVPMWSSASTLFSSVFVTLLLALFAVLM